MSLVMPTRVLVVGGGGREHALAWKLGGEPGVNEVLVAPGSDGIAREPRVLIAPVDGIDPTAIVELARARSVELVVVGPEAWLAEGISDALADAGVAVFGPSRAAARIETSKAFCHEIADAAGVAMARAIVARTVAEADAAVREIAAAGHGFVIKEDGLAAGKGVTVFDPDADPDRWLDAAGAARSGPLAGPIVVEERLSGPEASVIAICDGERAVALPPARDHKRLRDGDDGPNTGGMGAYSPLPDLDDAAVDHVVATVHRPILAELARRGTPFRGFLYAGLMLTRRGPVLLECNARLGDPEAQVILPRLAGALGPVLLAAARGGLPADLGPRLATIPGATVGIVLAGDRYPAGPTRDEPIAGLDRAAGDALVFHAGTRAAADGTWLTDGGRVLAVVGRGADLGGARERAETAAEGITFPGVRRRHDIAAAEPQAVGAR